jgi:TIR domain
MLKVFISYSREDIAFADQLYAALEAAGFNPTLDRIGVSGAADWRETINTMILKADTVVFVLSPASAASNMCAEEVSFADGLSKRIIPVLCRPIIGAQVPKRLQDLNYIYFYSEPMVPGSGFGGGLVRLKGALEDNLGWLREHTRLTDRAAEWDAAGRTQDRLLTGCDVAQAETWLKAKPDRGPGPTQLQRSYIGASVQAEHERIAERTARAAAARDAEVKQLKMEQEAERLLLETAKLAADRAAAIAKSRQRTSQLWLAASVSALMIGGALGWVWYDRTTAAQLAAEQANLMKDREIQLASERAASTDKDRIIAEKDKRFALLQSEVDRNKMDAVAAGPIPSNRSAVTVARDIKRDAGVPSDTRELILAIPGETQNCISTDTIDLMIAYEVGDRASFERRFSRPGLRSVPSVQGGIVIGIGYDLGAVSLEQFERDWRQHLPTEDFERLKSAIGMKGGFANDAAEALADITISYDAAVGEFTTGTLQAYAAMMESAFPNARELAPDSYGALVSLIFSRGPGMAGEKRFEMRSIRELLGKHDFAAVPEQLRAMKRLWPTNVDLQKRRDAEATLFEKGLAKHAVDQASIGARKM